MAQLRSSISTGARRAFAYAYAVLRDRAAAEDATQAAFLTAWLRFGDLREPKAFGVWLRRIVRTECVRLLRRTHPATLPLDEAVGGPWTLVQFENGFRMVVDNRAQFQKVREE